MHSSARARLVGKVPFAIINMLRNSGNKLLLTECERSVQGRHRNSAANDGSLPGATAGAHAAGLSRPSQTQSGTRRGMRPLIQAAISTARKTCTSSLASAGASSGIGSTEHPHLSGRCRPRYIPASRPYRRKWRPRSGRRPITQRGGASHPPDTDYVLLAESEVRRRPAAQSCLFGGAREERCHASADFHAANRASPPAS
jgi:hypothetical protein